ncbi:DUF177 domain-containing protein [Bacteroidota bacterium]
MRQYAIPFRGLKEGKHDFDLVVDNSFFEHFDSSEVKEGLVNVHVEMNKHAHFLELHFDLKGNVTLPCDRCLEPFVLAIDHRAVLYIRFGEKSYEQSEEVLVLADSTNEIGTEQYIYEYIHLALPYQRIHPMIDGQAGCDPEMMGKLDAHTRHDDESDSEDPRWDKLRELINNKK